MKVFLAADHRGFDLKNKIKTLLIEKDFTLEDLSAIEKDPTDDYTDYGFLIGESVSQDSDSLGIVFCASGVGIDIAANKVKGIRCGLGFDPRQIEAARHDDNINVLSVPVEYISEEQAVSLVLAFLQTPFGDLERYNRRIAKLKAYENK